MDWERRRVRVASGHVALKRTVPYARPHARPGKIISKVESEYTIGREHPVYGDDFQEEDHIVQGEVSGSPPNKEAHVIPLSFNQMNTPLHLL